MKRASSGPGGLALALPDAWLTLCVVTGAFRVHAARRDGEAGRAVTFSKSEQRGEDNCSHGDRQTEEFLFFIIRLQQTVYLLPAAMPRVAYRLWPPPSSTFVSCEEILNLDPTTIKAASNWIRRMSRKRTAALGGSQRRRLLRQSGVTTHFY